MAKSVTGHDVARLAGVSQATVSRALRNLPGTSPNTRAAVLRAAEELAYVASDSGRVLSTRSTRRVAVVSEELTNPYYPELVEPIRARLADADLRTVLIADSQQSMTLRGSLGVDAMADGSYDGVILTTTRRNSTLPRDLTEAHVPHVLVNRVLDHAESHSCTVDNRGGARAVGELLTALGHVRIAAVHGPVDTSTGRERAEAFRTSMRDSGIPLPRRMVRRASFSHESGMVAAGSLLDLDDPPTAIFCANDVLAFGALSAARRRSINVPEQLTIVGFDDIPMSGWPLIGLTTVRCDLHRLAREAVDLLLDEIQNPGMAPRLVRIPVEIQLRSTHAPV